MAVLRGPTDFYDYEASDNLAYNIQTWLDYGLLEIGAFTNITFSSPASGYTYLQKTYDDRHGGNGKVYEGLGHRWIWESGVSPIGGLDAPIEISGVYVDSTFYPKGIAGQYAFTIDYKNGRVVFDNEVSGVVQCEYSFPDVAVYTTESPQWKYIIDGYESAFNQAGTLSPSGLSMRLKQNRLWLPAVVVDVQERQNSPLQLGGGDINTFTVLYHTFSDRPFAAGRLADMINNQEGKKLNLFNANTAPHPYNRDGSLRSEAKVYTEISDRSSSYFWTYAYVDDSRGGVKQTYTDVYRAENVQTIAVHRYLSTY